MNVIEKHKEVITAVYDKDYYTVRFLKLIADKYPDDLRVEDETNLLKICSFWNEFWFDLPDSPVIHRPPFYAICELAEGGYLEGCDDVDE